jgi:hypothetical protein
LAAGRVRAEHLVCRPHGYAADDVVRQLARDARGAPVALDRPIRHAKRPEALQRFRERRAALAAKA